MPNVFSLKASDLFTPVTDKTINQKGAVQNEEATLSLLNLLYFSTFATIKQ